MQKKSNVLHGRKMVFRDLNKFYVSLLLVRSKYINIKNMALKKLSHMKEIVFKMKKKQQNSKK
jgi:hypothetical protein